MGRLFEGATIQANRLYRFSNFLERGPGLHRGPSVQKG